MSADEKLKALEEYEFDAPSPKDNGEEVTKLKAALSKANSDAAEWKRQFREKQTEQERAEAERAERDAASQAELNKYRTESRVNSYRAKLIESGYDAQTAQTMAEKLPEGIGDD